MKKVIVTQNQDKEIPTEIIAESIVAISQSMKRFKAGRLNDKALLALIAHDTKFGFGTIATVLSSLESLEETYLRKKPK